MFGIMKYSGSSRPFFPSTSNRFYLGGLRRRRMAIGLAALLSLATTLTASVSRAQNGNRAMIFCGDNGECSAGFSQLSGALTAAGAAGVDQTTTLANLPTYRMIFIVTPKDGLSAA